MVLWGGREFLSQHERIMVFFVSRYFLDRAFLLISHCVWNLFFLKHLPNLSWNCGFPDCMSLTGAQQLRWESHLPPVHARRHLPSCRTTALCVMPPDRNIFVTEKIHFLPLATESQLLTAHEVPCHSTHGSSLSCFLNSHQHSNSNFLSCLQQKAQAMLIQPSLIIPVEQSGPVHCGSQLQSPVSSRKVPWPEHCSWHTGSAVSQLTPPQPVEQWHSPCTHTPCPEHMGSRQSSAKQGTYNLEHKTHTFTVIY